MGKITILPETTKEPITLMGKRAGICWGADTSNDEKNYKRGMSCVKSNHGRVLEFVNVELVIEGYSAKTIREFYTHIGSLPSRLQESTRYINYSNGKGFDYVIPPSVEKNEKAKAVWVQMMRLINSNIQYLKEECDIPNEDATMLLPLAYETRIVDKRNLRNYIDMSRTRECTRAYWEFRELFKDIKNVLADYSDEWKWIVDNCFHPKCVEYGFCTESKSCGRAKKKGE